MKATAGIIVVGIAIGIGGFLLLRPVPDVVRDGPSSVPVIVEHNARR